MRTAVCFAVLGALAAGGCRRAPAAGVKVDPALAMMTPDTATALAGVKLDSLRGTGTWRRLAAGSLAPALDGFAAGTGLDLRGDVWELLFVFESGDPVVMVRGKFSPGFGGLEPRVRPGAPRAHYKGYTLIGDESSTVVFVNSSTAVTGAAAAVRGILDRKNRTRGIPPALEERIRGLPAGSQLWAVATGSGAGDWFSGAPGNWANLAKLASMTDGVSAAADLRRGAALTASAWCSNDLAARGVQDALRGLLGLARLATRPADADRIRLYDSLEVRQEGRRVRLSANLPADLVEKLIPMIR